MLAFRAKCLFWLPLLTEAAFCQPAESARIFVDAAGRRDGPTLRADMLVLPESAWAERKASASCHLLLMARDAPSR